MKPEFGAVDNEALFQPRMRVSFSQLVRVLRKLLEKCFRGEVKDTFVYPGELGTDSRNASLLSGCYTQDLKDCNANITGLQNFPPFSLYQVV